MPTYSDYRTVSLLMTGDEVLSGDILDSNSQYLCHGLAEIGLRVGRIVKVGDDLSHIAEALEFLKKHSQVVIMNGGLGPTTDDMTCEAVAKFFKVSLERNEVAYQHLLKICKEKGYSLNQSNLKQVMLPAGCGTIPNNGSCTGFYINADRFELIATPGVPSEMKFMWEGFIKGYLQSKYNLNTKTLTEGFRVFGLGESTIQEMLQNAGLEFGDKIKLGFRANLAFVDVKLTVSDAHTGLMPQALQKVNEVLGDFIIGSYNKSLASIVQDLFVCKSMKLAVAESCTGGQLGAMITDEPGASSYFIGGVTAYDNSVKSEPLKVPENLISKHGAVSVEVAASMVEGTLSLTGADFALSTTGVAGPGGGTSEKPAGLVYIGFGSLTSVQVLPLLIRGERERIRTLSCSAALDLARRSLSGLNINPRYSFSVNSKPT